MARAKTAIGILACGLCGWSWVASAQQTDSPLKSAAKIMGLATDVAPPADFVLQSRPQGDPGYIPIFQTPPEPTTPALGDKELTSVKSDLDSVEKRHDSLRKGFAPAVKALAEQQAAAKAAAAKTPPANQ